MSITPNARRRQAFLFGRQTALRSTSDIVDQLQAQIHQLQARLKTEREHYEKEIAALTREMLRASYELAKRDVIDAFAKVESPSALKH